MKVVSLVERACEKRSVVVNAVNVKTLTAVLDDNVCKSAQLMTDEHAGYTKASRDIASHGVTRHSARPYVDCNINSKTVKSSFSLLMRGLTDTLHHVGEQHLQRYFTEYIFRWNHRKTTDRQSSDTLLHSIAGKRLTNCV